MPMPWTNRIWREFRAGNLTRSSRDVLLTLHTYRGHGGVAWPSHAALAHRARCSVRTVQRALQQAQRLDLVQWSERRVRSAWRWLRTSNLYRFISPAGPVQAGIRALRTTGQLGRGGESEGRKAAQDAMQRAAAGLPDLLAMRRAVVEARLLGNKACNTSL
jgi:hypothetical protein